MTAYAADPLKDSRHRDAASARAAADWLDALDVEGKAARSILNYETTVARLLRDFPNTEPQDWTVGEVVQVLREVPPASRAISASHLNSFFGYLKKARYRPDNLMDDVPKAKRVRPKIPDVFTETEVAALVALPAPDGWLHEVLFGTGIRQGEARSLRMRHFNLAKGYVTIREGGTGQTGGTKGGKERMFELHPDVVTAVANLEQYERLDRDDFLWYMRPGGTETRRHRFADGRKAIAAGPFYSWWTRTLKAAEVTYRRPHMSRHSFATMWRQRGGRVETLKEVLGHDHIETTLQMYVHVTAGDIAEDMALMGWRA